jgi:5-methylthioadenosine/S-adenosylhomocysteine deaminase
MSCLIRDVLIVSPLGEAPFDGWVEIVDDKISSVGRGRRQAGAGQAVIEGSGSALIPGLVNTHAHSHSSLTRGSAEGMALEKWLLVIQREQAQLTDEQAYVGALATYAEALLSGTTAIVDMCIRPESALRAAREIGIRAVIVPYVADTMPFAPTLECNARLLEATDEDDRVRVWVGLHDLESCSDDLVREGAKLARGHGTGLHLHCSETRFSVEKTKSRVGRTPVAQLLELGAANNRLDMFDVMKFASLLHKGVSGDPRVFPPDQILEMATRGGAAALDLPVGAIVPGMKADLALVRLDGFHVQPSVADTIVTNLVHAARGSDVATVMVDGRVVVKDGRLADTRWDGLSARARQVGLDLLELGRQSVN